MLFHSYSFIIWFLPTVLVSFYLLARVKPMGAALCLLLSSLWFYGSAYPEFLPILIGSFVFNYLVGWGILRLAAHPRWRWGLVAFGIVCDLLLLGYFKYSAFLARLVHPGWIETLGLSGIVLPLGISFYTFTQIAFLVDAYRGKVTDYHPIHFALFVTYFPHLIAGPILHHREMVEQFRDPENYKVRYENLAVGMSIFILGLFKKVALADPLAAAVEPVFSSLRIPTFLEAWGAALSYSLQIYFDFSGYSDMAIGISLMFGFKLPLNFDSPYRSGGIIEFWRRWHMTLSRFLRDYLYIPLGGGRHGEARRFLNLAVTMLLGGLWHGASWTFVVWGGLHGVYLGIQHAWNALKKRWGWGGIDRLPCGGALAVMVTFLAVVVGWVLFRAKTFGAATMILKAMAGLSGGAVGTIAVHRGIHDEWTWIRIVVGLGIVWFLPNTRQFMSGFRHCLDDQARELKPPFSVAWRPRAAWWFFMGVLFYTAMVMLVTDPHVFIYYQF